MVCVLGNKHDMKWEVIVKKHYGDLRLLSDVLACWGVELSKNEDELVLRSKKFEELENHSEYGVWLSMYLRR